MGTFINDDIVISNNLYGVRAGLCTVDPDVHLVKQKRES